MYRFSLRIGCNGLTDIWSLEHVIIEAINLKWKFILRQEILPNSSEMKSELKHISATLSMKDASIEKGSEMEFSNFETSAVGKLVSRRKSEANKFAVSMKDLYCDTDGINKGIHILLLMHIIS